MVTSREVFGLRDHRDLWVIATMPTIIDLTLTLPRNPAKKYVTRDIDKIEWIAWHHTGDPDGVAKTPNAYAHMHIGKGWSGIGYNYMIYESGSIFKVRPIGAVPACVHGWNTKCICIAFAGNFMAKPPSALALESAEWLSSLLTKFYPKLRGIKGHGEFEGQATACPGAALLPLIKPIASRILWATTA